MDTDRHTGRTPHDNEGREGMMLCKPRNTEAGGQTTGARHKAGTGPAPSPQKDQPCDPWVSDCWPPGGGIHLFLRPPTVWCFVTVALGNKDNGNCFRSPTCRGPVLEPPCSNCWVVQSPPSNALSPGAFPSFHTSTFSSLLHFRLLFSPLYSSYSF